MRGQSCELTCKEQYTKTSDFICTGVNGTYNTPECLPGYPVMTTVAELKRTSRWGPARLLHPEALADAGGRGERGKRLQLLSQEAGTGNMPIWAVKDLRSWLM